MPEPKRPLKVFLCHAHSDKDKVRALYLRLKREGVDAWLDKEKLLPGSDWELEIRKAVREADVVVVCLSKQFNQAGFRQKEVRIALDTAMEQPAGEIFIIPARLEECENLESLNRWHWVDLFEDDGYISLIRALRARADRIGATLRIRKGGQTITARPKNKEPEKTIEPSVGNIDVDDTIAADAMVTEIQETQSLEKAELEVVEKVTGEKAEKDAVEKTQVEVEGKIQQKAVKEKAESDVPEKSSRSELDRGSTEKGVLISALLPSHIKARLAYGIALILGLVFAITIYIRYRIVSTADPSLILIVYVFAVGVWATATNRRWVFLTAFSAAEISVLVLPLVFKEFKVSNASFVVIFKILIWGSCFELFLFQIRNINKNYSKILWSSAGGAMLFAVLVLTVDGWFSFGQITIGTFMVWAVSFGGYMLSISYVGLRFRNTLVKIWSNAFDV